MYFIKDKKKKKEHRGILLAAVKIRIECGRKELGYILVHLDFLAASLCQTLPLMQSSNEWLTLDIFGKNIQVCHNENHCEYNNKPTRTLTRKPVK